MKTQNFPSEGKSKKNKFIPATCIQSFTIISS